MPVIVVVRVVTPFNVGLLEAAKVIIGVCCTNVSVSELLEAVK